MGERELREKYGGKLAKAINRAIRAEIPGGNEALDRLTNLAGAARHSHWEDKVGQPTPEASAYFKHQREVIDRMEAQVRRTWGIPPAREGKRPAPRPGQVKPRHTPPSKTRSTAARASKPRPGGAGPGAGRPGKPRTDKARPPRRAK
jgi:hypothetical protein